MVLFPPAPGGGEGVEIGYKGKGVLTHLLSDGNGMPVNFSSTSAKGNERTEVVHLISNLMLRKKLSFLHADKGYDAKWLRLHLAKNSFYPMIAYRRYKNRERPPKSSFLKKLNCRWKIERTFAWIKIKFRRIQTRWERRMCYWEGFVSLAMIMLWVDKLVG